MRDSDIKFCKFQESLYFHDQTMCTTMLQTIPEEANLNFIEPNEVSDSKTKIRFKGVVAQQNGHFGAQIYSNQSRIWIGTFKTELEAAKAYDRLAMRVRSEDSYRNVDWTPESVALETEFQKNLSDDDLLRMLKDHSYPAMLLEFVSKKGKQNPSSSLERFENCRKKLFEKELTLSDVGKLNRLVIPKKCARKLLTADQQRIDAHVDVEIPFFDVGMKCWKFRFCYWKSSKSYVFTRGWNKFVRSMNLKAKDTVAFFECEKKSLEEKTYYAVDIVSRHEINQEERRLRRHEINQEERRRHNEIIQEERKRLKLFGMEIIV